MKVNKRMIRRMKNLRTRGYSFFAIADRLRVSRQLVRYHLDPEAREKLKHRARARYKEIVSNETPEEKKLRLKIHRDYQREFRRNKYAENPEFREKVLADRRKRYAEDPEFRENMKRRSRERSAKRREIKKNG